MKATPTALDLWVLVSEVLIHNDIIIVATGERGTEREGDKDLEAERGVFESKRKGLQF